MHHSYARTDGHLPADTSAALVDATDCMHKNYAPWFPETTVTPARLSAVRIRPLLKREEHALYRDARHCSIPQRAIRRREVERRVIVSTPAEGSPGRMRIAVAPSACTRSRAISGRWSF
jgi:hypothetical protein